jgi:hypothetical protein
LLAGNVGEVLGLDGEEHVAVDAVAGRGFGFSLGRARPGARGFLYNAVRLLRGCHGLSGL